MSERKKVPVTYKRTGEVSQLKPGSTPQRRTPTHVEGTATQLPAAPILAPQDEPVAASIAALTAPVTTGPSAQPEEELAEAPGAEQRKTKGKPKAEIESFEQFVAYAYSQKGRRISLKSKVQEEIGKEPSLSADARIRLMRLVQEDYLVAVPRQLLLASMGVKEFQRLRDALRDFAREALLAHPIFGGPELGAVLRNLDEAPPTQVALSLLARWRPTVFGDAPGGEMKPIELDELRRNSAYGLVTWIAIERSLLLQEVVAAVHQGVWTPRARAIGEDRSSQVRAITDITELAEVGLACNSLVEQALLMASRADKAQREAAATRDELAALKEQIASLTAELADGQAQASRDREKLEGSMRKLQDQKETEATHLRYDREQLRTRILQRLSADVEQLDVGLSALRTPEPKIHVLQDRIERVSDAMRAEIKTLRGDS